MTAIKFKSWPENYKKERDGRKPNTFRKIDLDDEKFKELIEYSKLQHKGLLKPLYIDIVNSEKPKLRFIKKISDITIYEGCIIISWRP